MNQQIAMMMASLLVMEGDFELFGEMYGFILKLVFLLLSMHSTFRSIQCSSAYDRPLTPFGLLQRELFSCFSFGMLLHINNF